MICRIAMLVVLAAILGSGPALAFDPFRMAGIDRRAEARVPLDLAFRDETGARVTLDAVAAGKPILLAPVVHDCPNICGVTLAGLAQAVRAQPLEPGEDFSLVAFGIDPAEGPAEAAASLAELRQAVPDLPSGGVHALTGTAANIATVTAALGYRYAWDAEIGQYAHIAAVAVLTPDGRLARWLYGLTPDPTDLRLALVEAGEGHAGTWTDQLLLLCYHYDPETGRYGTLVWMLLRLGGGITAGAGVAFVAGAALREHRAAKRGQP